jgi:hypothetical protein
VGLRYSGDIDRLDARRPNKSLKVLVRARAAPEKTFGLVSQRLTPLTVGIRHCLQRHHAFSHTLQLGHAVEMAQAHPPASNQGQVNRSQ